jgi:SulP family sulfate permease
VRPDTLKALTNVGLSSWFPAEQVFPEEEVEFSATLRAVRYAQARLTAEAAVEEASADPQLYYLV